MGFFDKVKSAAGVGTASLEVDIKNRPTKRGEDLVALIRVMGGKQSQKMNYCVADLRWKGEWTQKLTDGTEAKCDGAGIVYRLNQPGSEGVTIEPGKNLEFPITIKVPAGGPLSSKEVTWNFGVRADIEGAADPSFNTDLEIKE